MLDGGTDLQSWSEGFKQDMEVETHNRELGEGEAEMRKSSKHRNQ